jgi:hypothetical protein
LLVKVLGFFFYILLEHGRGRKRTEPTGVERDRREGRRVSARECANTPCWEAGE